MKKRSWILVLGLVCLVLAVIIFIFIFFVSPFFLPLSSNEEEVIKIVNRTGLMLMGSALIFFITFLISALRRPLTEDEDKYFKRLLF